MRRPRCAWRSPRRSIDSSLPASACTKRCVCTTIPSNAPRPAGRSRPDGFAALDNRAMSSPKVIFGFHAVGVRIKTAPKSVLEVLFDASRRDARMKQFIARAQDAGVRLVEADALRIAKLAGSHGHQGVAARVEPMAQTHS